MTDGLGTRFSVFPQPPFIPGYERPETVWISEPPSAIEPGPADRRIYVVDPMEDKRPYHFPNLPPYVGAIHAPVRPGPDGHFDHLTVHERGFLAAHAYACVRRVMDICQGYLGRVVPWFFEPMYPRLELVPHLAWDNAQSGFGFLELGEEEGPERRPIPFSLNFDVVAHETGHLMLLGVAGTPGGRMDADFAAYHEAAADLVALLGLLHFDTALDRILRRTRGDLLIANELDRIAEISHEKQVRLASNRLTMAEAGEDVHDRSRPFTGAVFDTIVEIYHTLLFERGMADIDPRGLINLRQVLPADRLAQAGLGRNDYEIRHLRCKAALAEARDLVGEAFLRSWEGIGPDGFSLAGAADAVLRAAEQTRASRFLELLEVNFAWRRIL